MIGKIALLFAPTIILIIIPFLIKRVFFSRKQKLLKLVEKNKKLQKFLYFLLVENYYKIFISHLKSFHSIIHIEKWIKHTNEPYYISEAFIWNNTRQGYEYWNEANKKWISYYKHNNHFNSDDLNILKLLIDKTL